jgi:hypothetical protein
MQSRYHAIQWVSTSGAVMLLQLLDRLTLHRASFISTPWQRFQPLYRFLSALMLPMKGVSCVKRFLPLSVPGLL